MSIFTEISEPHKPFEYDDAELEEFFTKHVEHDQKTHGNRGGKGKRKKVRDRIKETLTWKNPEGETVTLITYPQQRYKYGAKKRSRHTNFGDRLSAVAKQRKLNKIAKQLKAKE
jgi:hypothetical protein